MVEFKTQVLLKEIGELYLVLHFVETTAFNIFLITGLTKSVSRKDFSTYHFNANYLRNIEAQIIKTLELRM